MTISAKTRSQRKNKTAPANKTIPESRRPRPAKIVKQVLTKRIVDPDALRRQSFQAAPDSVSSVDLKRGLKINMKTIERARKIFNNLFYAE